MQPRPRHFPVSTGVYVELVGALFSAVLPSAIMALSFAVVATFFALADGTVFIWLLTAVGIALSLAKLLVLAGFRRADSPALPDAAHAARWERRFAATSFAFASVLGIIVARTFLSQDAVSQMLATGMLFGYCAGLVAQVSVRPMICAGSLPLAAVPAIAAAAVHGGAAYWMIAAMFAIFLAGSFENVRHVHRAASARIRMRQEMAALARHDDLSPAWPTGSACARRSTG